jgi:hypothetical protein
MSFSPSVTETRELASEIKFLVTPAQAQEIREWARARLDPDPHASGNYGDTYRITSLYFDTKAFDIYHRRGSFGRGKYRVRRYDAAGKMFLERKLRTKNLVSKRRSIVASEDLGRLQEEEVESGWPGYWFHRRLLARELHPVCQISYLRTARVGEGTSGPIRLTLDQDIQTLRQERIEFAEMREAYPLPQVAASRQLSEDYLILELKFTRQMPAAFKQLIGSFTLRPQPLSKYRLAAEALGLVEAPVRVEPAEGLAGVLDV